MGPCRSTRHFLERSSKYRPAGQAAYAAPTDSSVKIARAAAIVFMGCAPSVPPLPDHSAEKRFRGRQPGSRKGLGAGEGNRTLVISLEGCCSTIELHPHQAGHQARHSPCAARPRQPGPETGGGRGRTRTYEGVSQRIYSPPPLPLGTLSHKPFHGATNSPDGRASRGAFYGDGPLPCQRRISTRPRRSRSTAAIVRHAAAGL